MARAIPIALTLVAFLATSVRADGPFTLHGTVGASFHNWWPGTDKDVIEFETEGLQAVRLDGRLGWRGRPLLGLSHARTLRNSAAQEEMLAASGDRASALTETLGYLDLLAVIAGSDRFRAGEMSFWQRLTGLRISYSHDLYTGRTAGADSFVYIGSSPPDLPDDGLVNIGDRLSFKTVFRDLRVLTPVWFDPVYPGAVVRVGYFQSRWEKVAEAAGVTINGLPVVQDVRLDTAGVTVSYENSLERPGVGWGLAVDVGLGGKGVQQPAERPGGEREVADADYSAARTELRWNLVFGNQRSGVALTVGARAEIRSWRLDRRTVHRDVLTQVYGRIGFDLVL